MIDIEQRPAGILVDLDETFLKNDVDGENAHTIAVVDAVQIVMGGFDAYFNDLTVREAHQISQQVPTHTIEAGLEQIFINGGLGGLDEVTRNTHIQHILEEKNARYTEFLKTTAEPVDGAVEFYRGLAEKYDLQNFFAIQSGARFIDAATFVGRIGMTDLIPEHRMFTRESLIDPRHSKPHPEINELAFKSLGLPESDRPRVYSFDDDIRGIASILAARNGAGQRLRAVGVTTVHSAVTFMSLPTHLRPDIAGNYQELSTHFGLTA